MKPEELANKLRLKEHLITTDEGEVKQVGWDREYHFPPYHGYIAISKDYYFMTIRQYDSDGCDHHRVTLNCKNQEDFEGFLEVLENDKRDWGLLMKKIEL